MHFCPTRRSVCAALAVATAAVAAGATSTAALAQSTAWPMAGKPIRIVVPFPAGSGSDANARLVGKLLSEELGGHVVIIDNKPGAGTFIGSQDVARSAA